MRRSKPKPPPVQTNYTAKLLQQTISSSALSPLESRIVSIADQVFSRHIGFAALQLGFTMDDLNERPFQVANDPNVVQKAWQLSLRTAASMEEPLRQLRNDIEEFHGTAQPRTDT